MLNEIKEYEQYTYPLDAKHPAKRLKHRALCNELSGTARAMTIIARKSISEYEGPGRVDHAIRVLQVWCGDPKGDPETISEKIEYAWLPNYMIQILGEEKALEFEDYLMKETSLKSFPRYKEVCSLFRDIHADFNFDTIRTKSKREPYLNKAKKISLYSKELGELGDDEGKKNQRKKTSSAYSPVYNIIKALVVLNGRFGTRGYKQKMFNDNLVRSDKNDFRKITYEKIVADAITAGPLKRRYLVCEDANFSEICYCTEDNKGNVKTSKPFTNSKKKKGEWSEPTKKKLDLIMKTVAAFLLEQEARDATDQYVGYAPVNLTYISNWLASSTKMESLKAYKINGLPIFMLEPIYNVAAISIDTNWMQSCGWKIVTEEKLDAYLAEHPNAIFYSDHGSGQFLRKNVRYT